MFGGMCSQCFQKKQDSDSGGDADSSDSMGDPMGGFNADLERNGKVGKRRACRRRPPCLPARR